MASATAGIRNSFSTDSVQGRPDIARNAEPPETEPHGKQRQRPGDAGQRIDETQRQRQAAAAR